MLVGKAELYISHDDDKDMTEEELDQFIDVLISMAELRSWHVFGHFTLVDAEKENVS